MYNPEADVNFGQSESFISGPTLLFSSFFSFEIAFNKVRRRQDEKEWREN